MNEQIKKITEPVKSFWEKLSSKAKKGIIIGTSAVLVLAVVISLLLNRQNYVILYPSLDRDEAVEVISKIEERNISYKEEDGTIYVPEEQEESLRMDLSNQGHPYSTYNYDFFLNNVDAMTTDSEKKILEKYQLNQKLESVIESIDCIKKASVTLNIPEDSGYVLSTSKSETTAGVTVTLESGQSLSGEQVLGIKNLISKSVPNLKNENVAVIDTSSGKEFGTTESIEVDKTSFKLQIQSEYEAEMEQKIADILNPVYGSENTKIVAKSDIDVDKSIQEITTYVPSQDNSGVISKSEESYVKGDGSDGSGGVVGTDSNTGTTTYSEISTDDQSIYISGNKSYEYLVSKIQEQIEKDSAKILNLTVSVVVNNAGLNETEKSDIASLVANAAGINKENVFVLGSKFFSNDSDKFPSEETKGLFTENTLYLILAGVIALILIVIIIMISLKILISKRKKSRAFNNLKSKYDENSGNFDESGQEKSPNFEIGEIKPNMESKTEVLRTQIKSFTGDNPEIAAQLIRTWLKGNDAND